MMKDSEKDSDDEIYTEYHYENNEDLLIAEEILRRAKNLIKGLKRIRRYTLITQSRKKEKKNSSTKPK